MCVSVCVCVWLAWCLPFLYFSYNTFFFIARAREIRSVLLVFIRPMFSVFLPGCSSLSLSSPLNYYVCAHSGVTLNPGFNLLSDRWHKRHVCCSDIWQALTLRVGSIITVIKSRWKKKDLFTCVRWMPILLTLIDCKLFLLWCSKHRNNYGGWTLLMLIRFPQYLCVCCLSYFCLFSFYTYTHTCQFLFQKKNFFHVLLLIVIIVLHVVALDL